MGHFHRQKGDLMSDASAIAVESMATQGQLPPFTALDSPTTEKVEDGLFELIVSGNLDELDCSFCEIDEYFARAEEDENETEHREALYRLLAVFDAQ
jgi:hypothetical protein